MTRNSAVGGGKASAPEAGTPKLRSPAGRAAVAAAIFAFGLFAGATTGLLLDSRSLWNRAVAKFGGGEASEIRADYLANFSDAWNRTAKQVACPPVAGTMVALLVGQSNAANFAQMKTRAGPAVSVFYEGRCYEASDPVLGATGNRGSIWPRFGDQVVKAGIAQHVLLVPVAVGSTSMESWAPGGVNHPRIGLRVAQLAAQRFKPTHALVTQGEFEAESKGDPDAYRDHLTRLISALRQTGARTYVATVARCTGPRNDALRSAQQQARRAGKALAGPDFDDLGPRINGCHFSDTAAAQASSAWFDAIRQGRPG